MKKINKVIAFLLVILLFNTISPECLAVCGKAVYDSSVTAFNKTLSVGSSNAVIKTGDSFNSAVSDLIKQDQNLFCEVVIDLKENTIKTDDEEGKNLSEYGLNYNDLDTSEVLVPVIAVLNETGTPAVYDEESGEIVVSEEESYSISQKPEVYGDPEAKNVLGLATTQEAEKELLFETDFHDGKIIITAPCQTARLIVHTKSGRKLSEFCGAETVVGNGEGMYVLQYASAEEANDAYSKLSKLNVVESVSFDKVLKTTAVQECNGKEIVQSDRFKNYLKESNMDTPLIAAVIDTGADITHEMISDRIVGGYNFIDNSPDVEDRNGHGTHVSGIIASNTNENVKIMPVKVLGDNGSGTELSVALGIKYAVSHGAKVLNLSLSGRCSEEGCEIEKAVRNAVNNSVTVCVAAGNSNDDTSYYCPARIKDCITVASGGLNGSSVSYFSNYGDSVDITAPGENILSAKTGGGYVEYSGTSMATPFVAAAAALLLSENPLLTPAEVESTIKHYSSDMLLKGRDNYSGEGYLNFGIFFGDNIPAAKIEGKNYSLSMGRFKDLFGYYYPVTVSGENGTIPTDRSFSFEFDKENVARFDSVRITAWEAGIVNLRCYLENGSDTVCRISVMGEEIWINYASDTFAGGDGSEKSPYLISNAEELSKFALEMRNGNSFENKYLKLTNDIDLSGKYWISAAKYTGLSLNKVYFMGNFDGNNHKIINLTIFDPDISYRYSAASSDIIYENYSFIGQTMNATITDLGLENVNFTSKNSGPLVKTVYQGTTIKNCYTTGFSNGCGLFYKIMNSDIDISDCFSSATVTEAGIAKTVHSSLVPEPATIRNTFFCGEIVSRALVDTSAAFLSVAESPSITNMTTITDCFSVQSGLTDSCFIDESINSQVNNCYYGVSENNTDVPDNEDGVTITNFENFKSVSFYANPSNWSKDCRWDFDNTWAISPEINNGYPYLKKNIPGQLPDNAATGTWLDYASSSFESGNGTEKNPFTIKTPEQLARLSYLYRLGGGEGKYFKLIEDIDLSSYEWYPIGAGFAIESESTGNMPERYPFFGNIDGDGHTIKGMIINRPEAYSLAFICRSNNNYIRNINFTEVYINGYLFCAAVSSKLEFHGAIENCTVSGNVSGFNSAGIASEVDYSSSIIGSAICDELTGERLISAIAHSNYGTISKCTNLSKVRHIVGIQYGGNLKDCLSTAGKIFNNYLGGEVLRCIDVSDRQVYFNNELKKTGGYVTASIDNLKDISFFEGWDFENVWYLGADSAYPVLKENTEFVCKEELPTDSWADIADTNLPGDGTKNNPYLISTAQQLAGALSLLKNAVHFKLVNNIDLQGKLWPSSFVNAYLKIEFYFDGNNKTIFNMTTKNGSGLFGFEELAGEISNLNIENIIGNTICAIIYNNSGTIRNCTVNGDIETAYLSSANQKNITYSQYSAGICAGNSGTIDKCSYTGTASSVRYVGGICADNTGEVTNCYVGGILNGTTSDGICGKGESDKCIITAKNIGSGSRYFGSDEMKNAGYFKDYDFVGVWDIDSSVNDGYPFLRKRESKTITYELNGGTMPKYYVKDYIPGNGTSLPNPSKEGLAFDGWYLDKEFRQRVSSIGADCTDNIVLFAKWTEGYTVRFNPVRCTGIMESISVPFGIAAKLPVNKFINNNGKFNGWATEKDGKAVFGNCDLIQFDNVPDGIIDLYPVWKEELFFIRYNFNGNGDSPVLTDYRTGNTAAALQPEKKKEGCYFAGWSVTKDGEILIPYGGNITGRISDSEITELFAVWKKIETYTISFNGCGGTGTMKSVTYSYDPTLMFDHDAKILLNNLYSRKGYQFAGWATEKDGKVVYPNRVEKGKLDYSDGDVTLYAVWKANKYTISFASSGGTGTMKSIPASYNKSITLPECSFTPPKGYHFLGWAFEKGGTYQYKDKQTVKNLSDEDGAKVILYAVWAPNKYTVTFDANGGIGKMVNQSAVYNESLVLNSNVFTAPTGYHFAGWATSKSGKVVYKNSASVKNLSSKQNDTITLYAVWSPNNYTVVFKAGKGSGTMKNFSATYGKSEALPKNTFTAPKGYRFAGWSKLLNGKVVYKNAATVKNLTAVNNGKVELFAVWEKYDYIVKFNANGGSGKTGALYLKKGESATLKNSFTAPAGYHFAGWAASENGKVKYADKASVKDLAKTGSITLYAVWKANSFTISFNKGTGSGTMKDVKTVYGKSLTLPKNSFTAPRGYKFAGWATSKNGKVVYKNAQSVKNLTAKNNATVILYAVWKKA